MDKKEVFLIAGGDLRQSYLANIIAKQAKVYAFGLEKSVLNESIVVLDNIDDLKEQVKYVVLPLPVTNDGVNINMPFLNEKVSLYSLIPLLSHNAVIFGGKVGKESAIFTYKGFEVIDYLDREELTVLNAVPVVLPKYMKNGTDGKSVPLIYIIIIMLLSFPLTLQRNSLNRIQL